MNDLTALSDITPVKSIKGDQVLITMLLCDESKLPPIICYKRDWTQNSKEELLVQLSNENLDFVVEDVQSNKNRIEEIRCLVGMCESI